MTASALRVSGLPLVAITTTSTDAGGIHHQPQVQLYGAYVHALEQVGLASVLITPFHSAPAAQALLERCSGIVLTGGEDVDPGRYGEAPHAALGTVTPGRDTIEIVALASALERGMPVLGVCRGAQLMNVQLGGTLWQDIASQLTSELGHYQTAPWGERWHDVQVKPGSKLRSIVGTETLAVNSFHHQAIKDVAPGLEATAVAADGLIECVESNVHPWAMGVQWHPERRQARAPDTDPDWRLFAAFADVVNHFADHESLPAARKRPEGGARSSPASLPQRRQHGGQRGATDD